MIPLAGTFGESVPVILFYSYLLKVTKLHSGFHITCHYKLLLIPKNYIFKYL